MTYPHSLKTIYVLDHSPRLLESSKQSLDLDVLQKGRAPGLLPLVPISKSLWTSNVEAAIEFCRVIWDIYPTDKLVRFITCDSTVNILNNWSSNEQNIQQLLLGLAQVGPPKKKEKKLDFEHIKYGVSAGTECILEPTPLQKDLWFSSAENREKMHNRGRIICLTNIKTNAHARIIAESLRDTIAEQNNVANGSDSIIPIHHCEFHLIHVIPEGEESSVINCGLQELSTTFSYQVHVSQSGKFIATKLLQLAQRHFNLASTTVTGIPMKEEQNASSSANYDVELLHSADAHREVLRSGPGNIEGLVVPSKEDMFNETVTLKWCTPKTNTTELHHCIGAYRVTPVDVNGRPSLCLTNFLLSGRAVMLEQPRKSGAKVTSHMLASHGGEIYIHVLSISRSILEDPPSISEGCGGRVTDYRINDFGEFIRENRLAPATEIPNQPEIPVERAKAQIERITRLWPLTISDTIFFNMKGIDPLPALIAKDKLDDDDVLECKKVIYHLVEMESRNDPLPVTATTTRGKGPKRDEHYRQMWAEVDNLVRAHSETSPNHEKVYECLTECKRPDESRGTKRNSEKITIKQEKTETEEGWKDLDKYQTLSEREKTDLNKGTIKKEQVVPIKKFRPGSFSTLGKSDPAQSLLALWTNRTNAIQMNRHPEFHGKSSSSNNRYQLYQSLNDENSDIKPPVNGKAKT